MERQDDDDPERAEYLGHTVNFRTSRPSFKRKKPVNNETVDRVIYENTQEAIIEESVFLVVQDICLGRRRPTMRLFSGLIFCATCNGKMYLCRTTNFKPDQEHYICSTYCKNWALCTTHSIRTVIPKEIVLLREAFSM